MNRFPRSPCLQNWYMVTVGFVIFLHSLKTAASYIRTQFCDEQTHRYSLSLRRVKYLIYLIYLYSITFRSKTNLSFSWKVTFWYKVLFIQELYANKLSPDWLVLGLIIIYANACHHKIREHKNDLLFKFKASEMLTQNLILLKKNTATILHSINH